MGERDQWQQDECLLKTCLQITQCSMLSLRMLNSLFDAGLASAAETAKQDGVHI